MLHITSAHSLLFKLLETENLKKTGFISSFKRLLKSIIYNQSYIINHIQSIIHNQSYIINHTVLISLNITIKEIHSKREEEKRLIIEMIRRNYMFFPF